MIDMNLALFFSHFELFDTILVNCKAWGRVKGLFKLGEYVSDCIDMLVMPIYRPIDAGKLQLAVTELPNFAAKRIVRFNSKEELKMAMMASIAAFPAAPMVFIDGKRCMDGGMSDFQPIVDENTLTVSPFYFSDADIRPSRYVPLWWAFLPPKSPDTVDWLYSLGWEDGLSFLDKQQVTTIESNKRKKLSDLSRNRFHPYDITRRVSVHRVLGYDLGNVTHESISFTMDFILLSVFILLWKPIALLLIYGELFLYIIIDIGK